jgi:imidazolonepropionase-like amidohydrolase
VPTLATYFALAEHGRDAGFTEVSLNKVQQVKEAGLESLSVCEQAGALMGFGTDLLGSLHRYQCEEFQLRAQVQSPLAILRSATSINARILNRAGKLGVIAPGALADLIVVDGNPLTDLHVFSERGERVLLVMKNGVVYKTRLN